MGQAEVATQEAGTVPDLVYDPNTTITGDDIALPRIKKGEKMSEQDVPFGSIFSELGPDDPNPVVLAKPGDGEGGQTEPVRFYVLAGPVKGWSYADKGEPLRMWRFDDETRHPDAWRTYKYVIAVPEGDTSLPYTILLTRTSTPAARTLNTILQKAALSGPTDEVALELTARKRRNQHGTFAVFQVAVAEVKAATRKTDLEVVESLRSLASAGTRGPAEGRPAEQAPDETPEI